MSFLWHSRLGHPSDVKFQSLGHVLPSLLNCCNKDCIVCSLAKQKRLLFPFDNKMSEFSFDLIHMDEWGPFSVPTSKGFTWFLTIMDDATRGTWVFLMRSKSKVRPFILSFYNMVLTQFGVKIKCIRSNNALGFNLS